MALFGCCWWWFVAGLLVGWLLWWLFDRLFRRDGEAAGVAAQRALDASQAEVRRLLRERDTARTEAGRATAERDAVQDELDASRAQFVALRSDFDAARDDSTRLRSEIDATRRGHTDARRELDAALVRLEATRAEYDGLRSDSAALGAKLDAAGAERDAVRAELDASHAEQARLRRELDAAHAALDTANADAARGSSVGAAAAFGFVAQRNGADELTIVEGIGPKIAELLRASGIGTFRRLAATPVATLAGILEAAGPRFRLADPATWPAQAQMCADGQWEALRRYQDELSGGVDRRGDA